MGKHNGSVPLAGPMDIDGSQLLEREDAHGKYFDPCLPLMFRLKGTVVLKIWWKLLLMILYTVIVVSLHNFVDGLRMNFPLTLVPVLGVATGLVLAFRTNTAYSRYWEGRKLWSRMVLQIRSLTLCIWAGVAGGDDDEVDDLEVKSQPNDAKETLHLPDPESVNATSAAAAAAAASAAKAKERENFIEKISAINLLVGFVYATKNYLRGEYSYDEEEMKNLINHLPRFQTPSSNQPFSAQGPYYCKSKRSQKSQKHKKQQDEEEVGPFFRHLEEVDSRAGTNITINGADISIEIDTDKNDDGVDSNGNMSNFVRNDQTKFKRQNSYALKAHDFVVPSNIPLEIVYYLFTYLKHAQAKGSCDAIVMRYMYGALLALIECLTGFERILRTPIPLAYSVHLHYCIWLYLLSLPYQLVGSLNWLTVPAIGLASFTMLGILRIGWEIENPFGYEENDLPLDDFCKVMKREIQVIVGHRLPTLGSWIMSEDNRPMEPNSSLHAQQLCQKSLNELREVLAKGNSMTFPSHSSMPRTRQSL